MKRMRHFVKRYMTSPAFTAAAASVVLLVIVLMLQPLIGMADNGEFSGVINGQGIFKLDKFEQNQYFDYFSSKYGVSRYYNDFGKSPLSSQNLYIRCAVFLNSLFAPDKSLFDIRFLSILLVLELAVGIYLLVDYISWRKSRLQGFVLGAVCVLMFADTAYTAYFNSFYTEGIVLVSMLLLTAGALLITQKRYPPLPLLAMIVLNAVILIFTKRQNAAEVIPLFILFLLIAFFFYREKGSFRLAALFGAVLLGVSGIVMYAFSTGDSGHINQYHAMTRGVMVSGENPEEALEEFGIDSQYSVLEGSSYYEKYPAADVENGQLGERFYDKYNEASLSVYYLTHPGEMAYMLGNVVGNGYRIRPASLGNYERESGRSPREQTGFFTLYSDLKAKAVPNTTGFIVIWILLVCAISFRNKQMLIVLLSVIAMGLLQIVMSIIQSGNADSAKYVFLYNVVFDIVSFVSFAPFLSRLLIQFVKLFINLFRRHKRSTISVGMFLLCIGSISVKAYASEGKAEQVVIISRQGEDLSEEKKLAEACGMQVTLLTEYEWNPDSLKEAEYIITTSAGPLDFIRETGQPAVCIGTEFNDIPGCGTAEYQNKAVRFKIDGYEGNTEFFEECRLINQASGKTVGTILGGNDKNYAFAAMADDGNWYIPCYEADNIGAVLLLGQVLQQMKRVEETGKTYFILDEVYAFSDLNKLCGWTDLLYENGIPFLVRVMPIYENLDYPAFLRFTQVLRYMQSRGGTITLHEPFMISQHMETEPLVDKMERFKQALTEEFVYYREPENIPYFIRPESLQEIVSENKNFGSLPIDIMVGVTPEKTNREFTVFLEQVNRKWMLFTDLQKMYEESTFIYKEQTKEQEFDFRETKEAAFTGFFDVSDRILMSVVGFSLILLVLFLLVGRKWYRRKFYR